MKKVEVLYYEGCTEGLWAKIRMDEEEEEEIITIPMSNEDINEYIGRHYPEEKATLREAEQDDWEDERRANEEYIEKISDAYQMHEEEIDRHFMTKYIKEEYGKDANIAFTFYK
ncbi:hypothetical protein [Mageeibacillus indolicus]|uniref:hypothetical protein n=1 Tax=Mageeibacillus indolicus TaxID=884684 RepID=UPI0004DD45C4|nr:hypothetical protein [Mageeibacillus indolicus]KFA57818.1 hypothetical protein HMPREF1632_00650 [Mageeibacillus indolicus 0009-5]